MEKTKSPEGQSCELCREPLTPSSYGASASERHYCRECASRHGTFVVPIELPQPMQATA